ncbi:MAG: SCO family protein [Gammaproteobacteria bacterium]|nr:SCO family protein [Gammaproteobacteria bacterium]
MANKIFLTTTILTSILVGAWFGYSTQNQDQDQIHKTPVIQGAILPKARAINNVQLRSVDNQLFTVDDFKDHWSIVFVGYTNCPDVCPNTLSVLSQVVKLMEEQDLLPPRVIFISIDPQRDKLDLIDQYVKYFNKKFIGISGDKKNLASITKQMSVVYAKAPGADGTISNDNYLMDHSSSLILLNPEGHVQSILSAPHTPMQIIDSIIRTQVYYNEK